MSGTIIPPGASEGLQGGRGVPTDDPSLKAGPTDPGSLRPGLVLESSTPVRPVAKGLGPGIAAAAQVLVPFYGKLIAVGILQLNRADNLVRAIVVDVDCNVCHWVLHRVSCRSL